METYKFTLTVEVEVQAYSHEDAVDLVKDTFGPGEDCGVEVLDLKMKDVWKK